MKQALKIMRERTLLGSLMYNSPIKLHISLIKVWKEVFKSKLNQLRPCLSTKFRVNRKKQLSRLWKSPLILKLT